jgi:ferric enterobactin receptor
LLLQSAAINMNEVIVKGTKAVIENQINKMGYNLGNDLTHQGGVVINILKRVPTVSVDINGNIELTGNSNVCFLINGKPSSKFGASITNKLQFIPASQIKSIDIITSMDAK